MPFEKALFFFCINLRFCNKVRNFASERQNNLFMFLLKTNSL